jgi:type I restriction enzyme S subunit
LMQGTKVLSISKTAIQNTKVSYPKCTEEQTQIGNTFQKLDTLINQHQQKHDKLCSIKKAMLEKMFPKQGETVPEIRFKGFSGDWIENDLKSLCDSFSYGLNATATKYDGVNKYLRITDINENSRQFDYAALTSPDINLSKADDYLLKSGDILFARTGASVGKTYLYNEKDGKVYFAGFLIRAKVNDGSNPQFVFQNTQTQEYNKFVATTSQRSGQPGINAKEYSEYRLFSPAEQKEQTAIGNYFQKLDTLINQYQQQITKLNNIKQACLSKMFV